MAKLFGPQAIFRNLDEGAGHTTMWFFHSFCIFIEFLGFYFMINYFFSFHYLSFLRLISEINQFLKAKHEPLHELCNLLWLADLALLVDWYKSDTSWSLPCSLFFKCWDDHENHSKRPEKCFHGAPKRVHYSPKIRICKYPHSFQR